MFDATLCISNNRQLPGHRELCVDTIRHHGGFGDMTARIEKVLASKDPGLTDENDWEEFSLKDVKVYIPGKTRYANILSASEDNPLMVTGQLEEVDEGQESLGKGNANSMLTPSTAGIYNSPTPLNQMKLPR